MDDIDGIEKNDKQIAEQMRLLRYGGSLHKINETKLRVFKIAFTLIFVFIVPVQILLETQAQDWEN